MNGMNHLQVDEKMDLKIVSKNGYTDINLTLN